MRAAGVDRIGAEIRLLELPEPRPPRAGEVLLGVRACGGRARALIRSACSRRAR